jgi:hypothetical protein
LNQRKLDIKILDVLKKMSCRKDWIQMLIPSLTMIAFIGFAFCMALMIVVSIIPLYIGNNSVEKTRFIQTSMIY